MEFSKMRNNWVLFFNLSLKMHADIIAGRQITQNQIFKQDF